jgi:hypothetical protein
MKNTSLNSLDVRADWPRLERLGNEVSAQFPDRLVVFFRHGAGDDATGAGFAGSEYDFAVMPGDASAICGHDHVAHLAHVLGHHLGLPHTYKYSFWDRREAGAFVRSQTRPDPAIFDGDQLADTPPSTSAMSMQACACSFRCLAAT